MKVLCNVSFFIATKDAVAALLSYLQSDPECSTEDIEEATSPVLQSYFKDRLRQERLKVSRAVHVGLLALARDNDLQYHSLTPLLSVPFVTVYACLYLSLSADTIPTLSIL